MLTSRPSPPRRTRCCAWKSTHAVARPRRAPGQRRLLYERRLLRYNAILGSHHEIPFGSVVVLLRPEADRPRLSGTLRQHAPDSELSIEFRYLVVRTWQQPVDTVLNGALGTLPLAPISAVPADGLPAVIRQMDARIQAEASPGEAATLCVIFVTWRH